MTKRTDMSNTKYSIPSPLFDPNQFSVHPSGKCTRSAPVKIMNSPPAAILPRKPDIRAILPNDCPMMMSHATDLGMFFVTAQPRILL
jgi:hypothetical protein